MSSPYLSAQKIVKRFPGVIANNQVDFTVNRGEIHALLGENGAGKSTLMQILYGMYQMDSGKISIEGKQRHIHTSKDAIKAGIGMVHQEFMLVRRFSVVENIVLGMDSDGITGNLTRARERIRDLSKTHGLHVDPDQVIEHLPVGAQQRVEILKLLFREAQLLILDEPTAVLTPQETAALFQVLRHLAEQGHAIVIVTHKLHEIMSVSDRVTIMRDGCVVSALETRNSSENQLAKLMVGRDVSLRVTRSVRPRGKPILKISDLHVTDDRNQKAVTGIDITLHAGEVLGLAGVDGNGQSELAQALLNLRAIQSGQVKMADVDLTHRSPAEHHRNRLAYVPADRRHVGALMGLSIARNVILGSHGKYASQFGLLDEKKINRFAKELVRRFDVRPSDVDYMAGKLSGGNLQKILLGREIMRDPLAYVIEQPTRGLDVGAVEAVWREILSERDAGKAILLISAELEEILNLSDRIAVIYEGRIMGIVEAGDASIEKIGLMMAGVLPDSEAPEIRR